MPPISPRNPTQDILRFKTNSADIQCTKGRIATGTGQITRTYGCELKLAKPGFPYADWKISYKTRMARVVQVETRYSYFYNFLNQGWCDSFKLNYKPPTPWSSRVALCTCREVKTHYEHGGNHVHVVRNQNGLNWRIIQWVHGTGLSTGTQKIHNNNAIKRAVQLWRLQSHMNTDTELARLLTDVSIGRCSRCTGSNLHGCAGVLVVFDVCWLA